jgi:hypothetical protein
VVHGDFKIDNLIYGNSGAPSACACGSDLSHRRQASMRL